MRLPYLLSQRRFRQGAFQHPALRRIDFRGHDQARSAQGVPNQGVDDRPGGVAIADGDVVWHYEHRSAGTSGFLDNESDVADYVLERRSGRTHLGKFLGLAFRLNDGLVIGSDTADLSDLVDAVGSDEQNSDRQ